MEKKMIIVVVMAASLAMSLSGCCLIGLGVGAIVDSSKPDSAYVPAGKAQTLKPGKTITVTKLDGEAVTGAYLGMDFVTVTDYYETKYADAQKLNKDRCALPDLSQSITIIDTNSRRWDVEFRGFSRDFGGREYLLFRNLGQVIPNRVSLWSVSGIADSQGNIIQTDTLSQLINDRKIPTLSTLLIRSENDRIQIPTGEIEMVQYKLKHHGALTGFLIGACVDVIVVVATGAIIADLHASLWTRPN